MSPLTHPRIAKVALLALMGCAVTAIDGTLPLPDTRIDKLAAFFRSYHCPTPHHVEEYLQAADTYSIDYRLLPAISVVETTCGAYERRNNHWGWDSARSGFRSVKEGIEFMASQLANGNAYKDKAIAEKLVTYNPDQQYVRHVQRLMRQIENTQRF